MKHLLGFVGASLGGAVGWWLGERMGMMTAYSLSVIGSGIGLYAGRRIAARLLE